MDPFQFSCKLSIVHSILDKIGQSKNQIDSLSQISDNPPIQRSSKSFKGGSSPTKLENAGVDMTNFRKFSLVIGIVLLGIGKVRVP